MAAQLVAVLWAAHRNSESGDPFIVGQVSRVQISFNEVANKLS